MAASYTFKVRFMDDRDPFTVAYAEPTVPPTFAFTEKDTLLEQIPRLVKILNAPHQIAEAALQVSIDNSYLDLDSNIVDICEGGNLDPSNRKTILILRTSLSVRVHNCCETLLKASGRDLRKALFSLKRIFKDDQDLVHCFVDKGGLDTLVTVGEDADHNYIIYIIRALGEVMVYVDGMQGIIKHPKTIQWLYVLITKYGNKSVMLVKGCLELLLVFINYKEDTNSHLVVKAVHAVDNKQELKPWNGFMKILKDGLSNGECFLYSITLINKVLSNVISQDMFYDITDALEKQGIDTVHKEVLEREAESDVIAKIKLQINAYNAQLKAEDDENSDPTDQSSDRKSMPISRKNRRQSIDHHGVNLQNISAHAANIQNQQQELGATEEVMVTPKIVENGNNDWSKRAEIMDSNIIVPPPPPQKNDDARKAMIAERREKAEKRLRRRRTILNLKTDEDKKHRDDRLGKRFEEVVKQTQNQQNKKGDQLEKDSDILKNSTMNSWSRLKSKIDVIKSMRIPEPIDIPREKPKPVPPNRNSILEEDEEDEPHQSFDPTSLNRPTSFNLNSTTLSIKNHNFGDLSTTDDVDAKEIILTKPVQPALPPGPPRPPGAPGAPGAPPAPRPPGAPPAPPGAPPAPRAPGAPPAPRPPGAPPAPPAPPGAPPAPRPPGAPPAPRPPGAPPAPRPPGAPPAPRPPGAPPAPRAPGAPPVPGASAPLAKVVNKATLVKVFWNKVNLNKTTGLPPTVPGFAAAKLEGAPSLWKERPEVKVDFDHLTTLFTKKQLETKKSVDTEKPAQVKVIRVLDGNRSREVGIAMAKLPASRHIKQAILNMDPSHITRESIASLVKLVPTDEEKNQITEAKLANPDIPLGKEEDYVHTLSVIPNIRSRLNIWAFMIDFDSMEDEVADYLMDLKQCCHELQNCRTLHLIISYLLEIGNFLRQEKSDGFELAFLSKVADIKDTVKKQTLVHHIASMMHENHPEQGDLHKEIGHTHRIGRISFDEVEKVMEKMDELCDQSWDDLRTISKHMSSTNNILQRQLVFLKSVAERIQILKVVLRRVKNRYYNLLLYFGIDPVKKFMNPDEFCRIISEFALEYRTAIEAVILDATKKKKMKERRKTRGIKITDIKNLVSGKHAGRPDRSGNSAQEQAPPDPKKKPLGKSKSLVPDTPDTPEEVALSLESALKTEGPRKRTRQRLKSKMAQRKSLRRTLKTGITDEELIAAGIK